MTPASSNTHCYPKRLASLTAAQFRRAFDAFVHNERQAAEAKLQQPNPHGHLSWEEWVKYDHEITLILSQSTAWQKSKWEEWLDAWATAKEKERKTDLSKVSYAQKNKLPPGTDRMRFTTEHPPDAFTVPKQPMSVPEGDDELPAESATQSCHAETSQVPTSPQVSSQRSRSPLSLNSSKSESRNALRKFEPSIQDSGQGDSQIQKEEYFVLTREAYKEHSRSTVMKPTPHVNPATRPSKRRTRDESYCIDTSAFHVDNSFPVHDISGNSHNQNDSSVRNVGEPQQDRYPTSQSIQTAMTSTRQKDWQNSYEMQRAHHLQEADIQYQHISRSPGLEADNLPCQRHQLLTENMSPSETLTASISGCSPPKVQSSHRSLSPQQVSSPVIVQSTSPQSLSAPSRDFMQTSITPVTPERRSQLPCFYHCGVKSQYEERPVQHWPPTTQRIPFSTANTMRLSPKLQSPVMATISSQDRMVLPQLVSYVPQAFRSPQDEAIRYSYPQQLVQSPSCGRLTTAIPEQLHLPAQEDMFPLDVYQTLHTTRDRRLELPPSRPELSVLVETDTSMQKQVSLEFPHSRYSESAEQEHRHEHHPSLVPKRLKRTASSAFTQPYLPCPDLQSELSVTDQIRQNRPAGVSGNDSLYPGLTSSRILRPNPFS